MIVTCILSDCQKDAVEKKHEVKVEDVHHFYKQFGILIIVIIV